jgi:hypothetical protein
MAVLLAAAAVARAADEPVAPARIESVGLFKNGVAIVRRVVDVRRPGVYRVDDVPSPVHGTFWIESAAPVEARVTWREVDAPSDQPPGADLQSELAGRRVTIQFREPGLAAVSGRVAAVPRAKGESAWNRQYQQPEYAWWAYGGAPPAAAAGRFLVLETDNGREYVDPGAISHLAVNGRGATVRRREAVLILDVKQPAGAATGAPIGPVTLYYLTKGIAWSPAYRVNLADGKTLSVEQQAVVRNELADLAGADVSLISGYPSVQFAHVTSPMAPGQTWVEFFRQMSQQPGSGAGRNAAALQQVTSNVARPGGDNVDLSALPTGEGSDIYYQPLGKQTLAEGDVLTTGVARASAAYERLVEWVVPDTRNADGRAIQPYERQQNPDQYEDAVWDAVRFKNPLPFAMTTAPAIVTENGRFVGQRMSFWVNRGEETTLQVTKALSIRTRAVEREEPGERPIVWVAGDDYQKVPVTGELTVSNHRAVDVQLVIRRQFSGELTKADADPRRVLREEGVYSVNPRNELTWTLTLKPGEEKTLAYRYTVLVNR